MQRLVQAELSIWLAISHAEHGMSSDNLELTRQIQHQCLLELRESKAAC